MSRGQRNGSPRPLNSVFQTGSVVKYRLKTELIIFCVDEHDDRYMNRELHNFNQQGVLMEGYFGKLNSAQMSVKTVQRYAC
jgi:hypothetical protein